MKKAFKEKAEKYMQNKEMLGFEITSIRKVLPEIHADDPEEYYNQMFSGIRFFIKSDIPPKFRKSLQTNFLAPMVNEGLSWVLAQWKEDMPYVSEEDHFLYQTSWFDLVIQKSEGLFFSLFKDGADAFFEKVDELRKKHYLTYFIKHSSIDIMGNVIGPALIYKKDNVWYFNDTAWTEHEDVKRYYA